MSFYFVFPRQLLLLIVTGLIVIVSALVAYMYLPKATITVEPTVLQKTVDQDIIISKSAQEPDFLKFILPAQVVVQEVQEKKTVTRANTTTHEDFAKGKITLHNEQTTEQPLLPKTHLRHEQSGVFVLTDTAITIPPESEVTINVTAKEKGASGNVPPGKFIVDKLPASLQAVVYGESQQALAGGSAVEDPLTEEELNSVKQEVLAAAKEKALSAITLAAGGAPVRPELLTIEVISEESSASAGSLASSYTVNTAIKASGFILDDNDLLSLTLLALRSKQDTDEEFIAYDPQSFRLAIVTADFARGEAKVKGTLQGSFAQKIESTVLGTQNLAGLSTQEATEHFKQFPSVENVTVSLSPFWVSSIPARPDAISILIQSQKTVQ